MGIEDYFDPYLYDDGDNDQPSERKCKFCGKGNLSWTDDNGKWVLINNASGEIHHCLSVKKKVDINKLLDKDTFK